jgi:alkanesulfonate monooxygenase SsuD/methylene tetrahydromethanopterin reductase-like flavin-dependent oxidoreductase (luciferase family)
MIGPVQERIPIYLAAIGPKNTALAAEVADGWIPTLFSPDHVAEFRALLDKGAARAGRALDRFDIAPIVNVYVSEDLDRARDLMRPGLALYVGGMGSRDQNFYNRLVQRYGFEAQARQIQDLYLSGRYQKAAAAVPVELIDLVSLCGPRDLVRERMKAYREAGVGSLLIAPLAFKAEELVEQLRLVAELPAG